jgi:hypothetical protein
VGYARLASYDRCEPRYVTVMIEKDPNPNVLLWPPCTRVQRCSGCCPTDVLVCEPIMTEMVSLKVKTVYSQTCIKRSHLEQRKGGFLRQVTS